MNMKWWVAVRDDVLCSCTESKTIQQRPTGCRYVLLSPNLSSRESGSADVAKFVVLELYCLFAEDRMFQLSCRTRASTEDS